ncbi:conserved mitochondrial conserved DUF971 domain-containing protein [Andalucia godoyi]|uniref:Conserved mitochondrial conserved DUF971 domain-containing protein n=1 Tax=Andalucia godoyi TaxID=505711 RepID=A0A8K0AK07_ANDGO|nr:conserved mitochondrial conserved DUF971 domain-containing protein [Andalucia godoyi]|eukprot:ANDGO_06542.mRNA.1 conserved mitochondrial conserved DUF971 domain-containing protein
MPTSCTPLQIRYLRQYRSLNVIFSNNKSVCLPAELLRVYSPSADVQSRQAMIPGRRNVSILEIEPVGNYGIALHFDDSHQHGLYSWQYLYDLGENKISRMREYILNLRRFGLSRDPNIISSRALPKTKPGNE